MAEQEKEPLFPALPEDLKSLSDDEVQKLLDDHVSAAALIDADDAEFLAGLSGEEVIEQYTAGVAQTKTLHAENKERQDAYKNYQAEKAAQKAEMEAALKADDEEGGEEESGDEPAPTEDEVTAESEEPAV